MVNDDVLLADRRETISAMIADALGKPGVIGRKLQIVPRERHDLRYLVYRERPAEDADAPG